MTYFLFAFFVALITRVQIYKRQLQYTEIIFYGILPFLCFFTLISWANVNYNPFHEAIGYTCFILIVVIQRSAIPEAKTRDDGLHPTSYEQLRKFPLSWAGLYTVAYVYAMLFLSIDKKDYAPNVLAGELQGRTIGFLIFPTLISLVIKLFKKRVTLVWIISFYILSTLVFFWELFILSQLKSLEMHNMQ